MEWKYKECHCDVMHVYCAHRLMLKSCVCVTPLSSFRRLRFTSDPLQANKLVTVNLPVLSLHLDEDKASLLVDAGRLCPAPTVISLVIA